MEKELYIVRDDYGLWLSEKEPYLLCNDLWITDLHIELNRDWFPEITKENSPKKIKLIVE